MPPTVMTVTGPIPTSELGAFLPHEHVMSCFGQEPARYPFYPVAEMLDRVLPYLEKMRNLGLGTLADCTTAFFGRHPELLRRISQESGVRLLTNTGYYGAAYGRYIPAHAHHESAHKIAERWIREWQDGIDETEVRPGFIKTAVGDGPLSAVNRKLLHAAVLTHLHTGLTIQTHTGDNWAAAAEILTMLHAAGAHPSAWIWVHAQSMPAPERLLEAADQGAWISLDGIAERSAARHLDLLHKLKGAGLLVKVLLSHDGDVYCQGDFRPFEYLFTDFIPLLEHNGFSSAEIYAMTVENPANAFSVNVRTG